MTYYETNRIFLWLPIFLLNSISTHGQQVSFDTWAGSNISIQSVYVNTLNFGYLIKSASIPNLVTLSGAAIFEISAPEGSDLTVRFDAPSTLIGPDSKTIPISLKFAYSNQGLVESKARLHTIEVNKGLNMVTFPVQRSAMALQTQTSTFPESDNTTRSTGKVYLYIYGSAGPPGAGAVAGEYAGTVNITVDYARY